MLPPYLLKRALPLCYSVAAFSVMRDAGQVHRGWNTSTMPSAPLTRSAPDRASSWVLAPTGCFTCSRTTDFAEIGAPLAELGSAPPLHGIALRKHHAVASPPWPSSHGILIFLSMPVF